jgi:3-phenylpropionate/trans-cinnamate dioxygenase ferredoxin subunit
MTRERIAATEEIPAGEVRTFVCDGREIAVGNVDGELYAIDDLCTHDGGPLGEGTLKGDRVLCPRHGAAFDIRTGRALTLPAVGRVATFDVTVEDGGVFVDCEERQP